jgi:SHS family lactate transporter-like MFS transporter
VASWLGWTLDAFDFTMFLLIMVPISQEFGVPLTEVAFLLSVTLWLRLVGAVGSGWLADRIGRKTPLMISILWYSICNFIAGFSPTFGFLFLFRALLGIGMGAEWPAGAALAMESWPARSRGFMSGMLQGSWSLGFLLASLIYGLAFNAIGWRGLLMIGVLPALSVVYVRFFVKEAAGMAGEPPAPACRAARGARAAAQHLQAGPPRQYTDRMLVDGEQFPRLLLD